MTSNKEAVAKYRKTYKYPLNAWKAHLKRRYGITPEDYNQMFQEQNGCCAICGIHQTETNKKFHVDHDHDTGEVRGLLCQKCNHGIGLLNHDKELLKNAIAYLKGG